MMNLGTLLILLSLGISVLTLIFLARSAGGNRMSLGIAHRLFYLSGAFLTFASIMLFAAFLGNSFQYQYVFNYSSRDLHILYKIAAFWAGQEGSFLLWAWLLSVIGVIVIRLKDRYENILLFVITITQMFILILLAMKSPFAHIAGFQSEGFVPSDGGGLNPLLQDPWMILHPPVLFLGYAAATVPFGYALAGMMHSDFNNWLRSAYRWVSFTVLFLGIGIFMGGYWAYKVLGWGGYWGWDPVENSSLIPWLVLVVLLHGLLLQRRKGVLVRTNTFLAIASFVLVLFSTFLTRSGVLSDFSVHSFGNVGYSMHILFFIIFYIIISAFLYISRWSQMKGEPLSESLFSYDNLLVYGMLTMLFYTLFILIGTTMPILSGIFSQRPFSVQPGYYNTLSIPLGILILTLLIMATLVLTGKLKSRIFLLAAGLSSILLGILFNLQHTGRIVAYVFTVLAIFHIIQNIASLVTGKSQVISASRIAHMGVALLVIGIIASNLHSHSVQKELVQNRETKIDSMLLTFRGITDKKRSDLVFTYKHGRTVEEIKTPYYIDDTMNSLYREPYIDYGLFRDVYIAPVQYTEGKEKLSTAMLRRGETASLQDVSIKFLGFDVDRMKMMKGQVKVFARLQVTRNNRTHMISPGISFLKGEGRNQIQATLPGTQRAAALMDFSVSDKIIQLYLEPPKDAVVPGDSAIVEVSFKRLIWFVWLSTILIAAGAYLAMRKE